MYVRSSQAFSLCRLIQCRLISFSRYDHEHILDYAGRPQTSLTLKSILSKDESNLLENAQFLYKELPIRLAKRVKELESLPYGLSQTEPVRHVKVLFLRSFWSILSSRQPRSLEDEIGFTKLLEEMLDRHSNVVPTMAQGILEIQQKVDHCPYLQDFLDRFYLSRLGIRFLTGQHCALHYPSPKTIGLVHLELDPGEVAEDAVSNASRLSESNYGIAPEVNIYYKDGIKIQYIPPHLHHMLFEILKNAMRATVEWQQSQGVDIHDYENIPPIDVVIADGDADWSIKISDQGGGINRNSVAQIWSYLHTTASKPNIDLKELRYQQGLASAPMAGLGYGLPLSRLFARYFGGDLQVVSMEHYGTDVYLYLNKLQDVNLFLD